MTDTDTGEPTMDEQRPRGPIETRSAQLVEVRYPQRTIELIVMPYEQPAFVEYQGKMIREVCARGAYDGIQRRANRIKVNRDHDLARSCGRCLSLHPSRTEGLVAEVRISATPLGDETLALADDGVLDVSAGFAVADSQWLENRSLRRLVKCWLGHIALTPEPAYEGASVLALRGAGDVPGIVLSGPTPNLDALRLADLERQFDTWRS